MGYRNYLQLKRGKTGSPQADLKAGAGVFLCLDPQNYADFMRDLHQDKTLLASHAKTRAFIRISNIFF